MALKDPNLPAGAIVEELPDGGAIRNDGAKLRPASENVWYRILTACGEQKPGNFDEELHEKNRRIWNGWTSGHLDEAAREALAKKAGLDVEDLRPLDGDELRILAKACGGEDGIPEPDSNVEFRNTHFRNPFGFLKCVVGARADFHSATFNSWANFHSATFNFEADFHSATFNSVADFRSATFNSRADFQDGRFAGRTDFRKVGLNGEGASSPLFHNCKMHQDTRFTLDATLWPVPTADNASDEKEAFTRLRQIMVELHKPDDQHFFFQREMAAKAFLGPWYDRLGIRLYGWVSDFGWSMMRPLVALGLLWVFGWLAVLAQFQWHCVMGGGVCRSGAFAAGLSFANLFSFLGFGRLYFGDFFREAATTWIILVAAAQNIFGVIFLFFFGLGLRNRFRLK